MNSTDEPNQRVGWVGTLVIIFSAGKRAFSVRMESGCNERNVVEWVADICAASRKRV